VDAVGSRWPSPALRRSSSRVPSPATAPTPLKSKKSGLAPTLTSSDDSSPDRPASTPGPVADSPDAAGSRWREVEPCEHRRQPLAFPRTPEKLLTCAFSRTGTHAVEEQKPGLAPTLTSSDDSSPDRPASAPGLVAGSPDAAGSRWREAEPCGRRRQPLAFPRNLEKLLVCAFSRTGTHAIEEQEAGPCPDSDLV
jgi:hypothetical protein